MGGAGRAVTSLAKAAVVVGAIGAATDPAPGEYLP